MQDLEALTARVNAIETKNDLQDNNVGDLNNLTTNNKSSVVGSINEIDDKMGHRSKTAFLSPTGNDNNDCSQEHPCYSVNGVTEKYEGLYSNIVINMADGTYNWDTRQYIYTSHVDVRGNSSNKRAVQINSTASELFFVYGKAYIRYLSINHNYSESLGGSVFYAHMGGNFFIRENIITTSTNGNNDVTNISIGKAYLYENTIGTSTNKFRFGLAALEGAEIFAHGNTIYVTNQCLYAKGGTITYTTDQCLSGTKLTTHGGRIYTGAQTSLGAY